MTRLFLVTALLLTVLIASDCGLLYTDIRLPRAYHSATPSDVKTHPADKIASGEACNQRFSTSSPGAMRATLPL